MIGSQSSHLLFLGLSILWIQVVYSNERNKIVANRRYPQRTLQCHSFYTQPDMRLICPLARMQWCVKEVIPDLQQDLCGGTQYFGDRYTGGQCILKKCATECVEGTYSFEYNGRTYSRQRYCCNDQNYCNSGFRIRKIHFFIALLVCIVSLILL